ncbi:chemotaxis protein CheW [Roseateles sp. BYS180W]|uniref:Chemotaxis protein CheW n=1 Tax=Roseateles rivi TaxID=3299028 RepID=A0ABW7FSK5_9BURK
MSGKQGLRELQQRLALRMQAVREVSAAAQWLAVECAGLGVLLSLRQAGEIFTPTAMTAVPHTVPWLLGVANLRGGLYTVVDLAQFLGLRSAASAAPGQRLVSFQSELGLNCALLVDELLGLRMEEQLRREPEDATVPRRPSFAAQRLRDAEGRSWQVLDLQVLASTPSFLQIASH